MLYSNLRIASAVISTMGFGFGLIDRAIAYTKTYEPTELALIFIALAFAVNISVNYPWERFYKFYRVLVRSKDGK